ncbi:unnamed protein product [Rhizoctonia solani]|uniref:BTB domain-containing protein n=1 Tax=Rhizoctonia solani TaxID=456999 RepID=A0A8H2XDX1_9AGAM|nr:unnamed protein product [Rhizoctonia solani]
MGVIISTHLQPLDINGKEWQAMCSGDGDDKVVDHAEYYFPDGNVIVVVQGIAFKLYRGILQKHSGLFKGRDEDVLLVNGFIKAEEFGTICQFLFPKEIGILPVIQSGNADKWSSIIHTTIELDMPGIRSYTLNKLAEDRDFVAANPIKFLTWIQDGDKGQEKLLIECIQAVAYRRSPLSREEAQDLSGTRANQVALARERIRSLFYNPNYWKVRIPNTLCLATSQHCSDGVFLAMTKQMSISAQSMKLGSESNLLQIAVDSMCAICRAKYAESLKQHANIEIVKCLGLTNEKKVSGPNSSIADKIPLKSCLRSSNV